MSDVLEFAGVGVRRGTTDLLKDVDWSVEEGERWVVLGPNGAGKTTLLQLAAARMHPTTGVAGVLGEVLGTVDVFELRPRIGVSSAAVADRIPEEERVSDVVVTAAYGVLGRWREEYEETDEARQAVGFVGGTNSRMIPSRLDDTQYVLVDKSSPTPERFPRRVGIPGKRPIGVPVGQETR